MTESRDAEWLRFSRRPPRRNGAPSLEVVDLFSGCGGMTLGLEEAARRDGARIEVSLAVDLDPAACAVYKANFTGSRVIAADVGDLFGGGPGDPFTESESLIAASIDSPTVLQGGPPCEGHSDLNNHTRRRDPKNALYLRMARAAEVLRPDVVVIENVPPVQWDAGNVVDETWLALEKLDYAVDATVVDLSRIGIPQGRKRYILVASYVDAVDPVEILDELVASDLPKRNVSWAIRDLESIRSGSALDAPSRIHEINKSRIDYLFDNDLFDLPNTERPPCHQHDNHSYKSMYGRLRWDRPAQTITTGFTSMGQGRFVHPGQRRTLTPHEAARLQTFPDWFKWDKASKRTLLSSMIGNAVPPLMMVHLGELLIPKLI